MEDKQSKITATVADYDESANTVKLKIRGLSKDNPAEKYIRMKYKKLKNVCNQKQNRR